MSAVATASFVRVGELACQKNSFLRELTATVVSCEPAKAQEGKKKKAEAASAAPLYDVVLSDSVLFPEGGGQPCDHGTLHILSDTTEAAPIPITNVQRRGDTCVLSCPVSIPPGTQVTEEVDWARRLDHMQHHTAQHLLTAMMERADMMSLPTISWSLTHPFCFIQLDVGEYLDNPESPYAKHLTKERKLSEEMVQKVQDACNRAIARGTAVHCDVFETREAYQAEQERREAEERKRQADADSGAGVDESRFRSRGIPADVQGPIRVITVDGVDSCTCCGTHLPSLAELQVLHLLHQETKGTTVKLFFVAGERAMRAFGDMYNRERQLTLELGGCRPEDFVCSVQRRAKEAGDAEKKMKRWSLELAAHEAGRLIQQCKADGAARKVVAIRRDDMELDFFNAVRAALNEAGLSDVVLVAAWAMDGGTAAAAHTILPAKDVVGQLFITGADKAPLEAVVEKAKEVMVGMKGGLSKMGFRGKGSLKEWAALVVALDAIDL